MNTTKKSKFQYTYLVQPLKDEDGIGYKAIIAKFPHIHVYADTVEELHEQVMVSIEIATKEMEATKKKVPLSDTESEFSGKVLVRLPPNLHEQLYHQAQAHNLSLNKYIESKLRA